MPHYLTQGRLSDIVTNIDFIKQLLPEKENVPGRANNESDLSKWSMDELAMECFSIMVQSKVQTEELTSVEGVMQPYPPEEVEKILPMLEELDKRCKGYLENPDYSAEKRPVLNAYLKDTQLSTEMTLSGVDFDRMIHLQAKGGFVATRMLMDVVAPKTAGMDDAQRKEALDQYEKNVKEGPYFDLIHAGLDNMRLAGQYEIARQDSKNPMTEETKQDFTQRMRDSQDDLQTKYENVLSDVYKSSFDLEKHPYMNKKTVDNLKESRGLKTGVDRTVREKALLIAGENIEAFPTIFAVEQYANAFENELKNLGISSIPGQQEKEELADLIATIRQAQELGFGTDSNPEKLKNLKEDLEKNGTTLQAYTRALQERMNRQAQALLEGASEKEAKAFEMLIKRTSAEGHFDPNVTLQDITNAERYIGERNMDIIQKNREDEKLDRELEANGYGVPQNWKAPEDAAEPMSYSSGIFLEGAMTKHAGITNGKLGADTSKKYFELSYMVRNLEDVPMYMPYGGGITTTTNYYPRVVETEDGKVIHAEKEWRDMLKHTNQTVREVLNTVPKDSKLQRAMLNYMESVTREALDPKGQESNNGKDALMSIANGFFANITEPGQGRNLNWADTEKLDQKYKFSELIQDCVTIHEIGRNSSQRHRNGIVDPEKEQKERELTYRLLDRLEKNAETLMNLPEAEQKGLSGLFDKTNQTNLHLDILGKRGTVPSIKQTAAAYRTALDKGWPLQEASLYIGLNQYLVMGRDKMQFFSEEQKGDYSRRLDQLEEVLQKDVSKLDEKGKADHFHNLSQIMTEVVTEHKKMKADHKLDGEQLTEWQTLRSTKCGHGGGKSVLIEALPDILDEAAQNMMKRAVSLGQAQPKDVTALQTKLQKNQLEDATLMLNRTGDAYKRAAQSQFFYQEMLTELQSLKKEGREDSDYFKDMENALKTVAGMNGKNTPKELLEAYEVLEDAAANYKEHRSGIHIFSSWRENGKKRRDLSERLTEMAKADREAMSDTIQRSDPIKKPDHKMSEYEENIYELRNANRGKVHMLEPLESQMLRWNSLTELNKMPKLTDVRQHNRVEGGVEGLKQQEDQNKEKKNYSELRNSVREHEKNVIKDNDAIKRSNTK